MKKLLLFFVVILLSMSANAFTGEAIIDGIKYHIITKAQTAEVRGNNYSGDIVIPASVTYNGVECSVTSIFREAFYGCSNMTSVTIPNSVTYIGVHAFENCSGLTSVTIPNSVTTIDQSAFAGCSGLTYVTIGNSVTSIRYYAFSGCSSLTSVTIPNSVTSIGGHAFRGCSGLTSVTIGNSVTSIGDGAFYGCSGLASVTIPNSVTSIGEGAFHDCYGLTSVTIPNSVTSIFGYTFHNCSSLTSVTIPNSVTSIGGSAFSGCSGLTSVTIPTSVATIYDYAFMDCSSLTTITIGSGLRYIGSHSLASCPELTDVYCYAENVPSTGSYPFDGSYIKYATLHVSESAIEQYKATAPWSNFGKIVSLDGSTPPTPEVKKCAMPTINYSDGKLSFNCETEGAEFVTDITDIDINKHYEAEISLTATYNISVYATKSGYENSDAATATLCWIDAEPSTEGIENTGIATVRAHAVLIRGNGNTLTITGAAEGTPISVYDVTGKMAGVAKASAETTSISTKLCSGQIALVKIGKKTVKVIMR